MPLGLKFRRLLAAVLLALVAGAGCEKPRPGADGGANSLGSKGSVYSGESGLSLLHYYSFPSARA